MKDLLDANVVPACKLDTPTARVLVTPPRELGALRPAGDVKAPVPL